MLGDRDSVAPGSIHHRDAALGGGIEVDVVYAYAGATDDAQLLRVREKCGVYLHRRANHEGIGIAHVLGKIVLDVVGGDDRPTWFFAEKRNSGWRSLLGDNDLHARPRA